MSTEELIKNMKIIEKYPASKEISLEEFQKSVNFMAREAFERAKREDTVDENIKYSEL